MAKSTDTKNPGLSKAKASPFRLNGRQPGWMAQQMGVNHVPADHTGSHMVRGATGGLVFAQLGYQFDASYRLRSLIDASLDKAPVAAKVFDTL